MKNKFLFSLMTLGTAHIENCDIGAGVGGVAQAGATVAAADINRKAVQDTNNMNLKIARESNEFAAEQADLAYERSTMSNQLAELQRAGYSAQQAKQLLAGNLSTATYTPPSLTTPTMQAPQVDATGLGQSIGQSFESLSQIGDDFLAPDGGKSGNIYASGALSFLNENAPEIVELSDHTVNTFQDFENWAKNQPGKYADFVNSKQWKRCKSFLPAIRAINANFQNIYSANETTTQSIERQRKEIENQSLRNRIDEVMAEVKEAGLPNDLLRVELDSENLPTLYQADYENAIKQIAQCKLDAKIASNPEYVHQQLALALQNQKTQIITAKVLELQNKIKSNGYKSLSDEEKKFVGIMSVYEDAGITDTEVGTVLAYMQASGINIVKGLQSLADMFSSEFDPNDSSSKSEYNATQPFWLKQPFAPSDFNPNDKDFLNWFNNQSDLYKRIHTSKGQIRHYAWSDYKKSKSNL